MHWTYDIEGFPFHHINKIIHCYRFDNKAQQFQAVCGFTIKKSLFNELLKLASNEKTIFQER